MTLWLTTKGEHVLNTATIEEGMCRGLSTAHSAWVYGYYVFDENGAWIHTKFTHSEMNLTMTQPIAVARHTVGAFSGIHDMQGTPIFENDYVIAGEYAKEHNRRVLHTQEIGYNDPNVLSIYTVFRAKGCFSLAYARLLHKHSDTVIVCGNMQEGRKRIKLYKQ